MRETPNISEFLLPVEDTSQNQFVTANTFGRTHNLKECKLLPLPTRHGRLSIPIFS